MKHTILILALALLTSPAVATPDARDGAHDFDFARGAFHTHIRRLDQPLTGSTTWLTYDGVKSDMPLFSGSAGSLEQIEADGPSHLEFITVRLYNARSHQWSLNFAASGSNALETSMVGEFHGGIGTFLSEEDFNGRTILVRQIWTPMTPNTYHFEQAFSPDFGATWETNFIADLTRTQPVAR